MERMTLRFVYVTSLIAVLGALVFVPAVNAADSSVGGYANNEAQVVGGGSGNDPNGGLGGTTSKATDGGGSGILPFTGLDLGFLIGGGVLLIAVGAALARFRPQGDTT
jgi:hypothetical protein